MGAEVGAGAGQGNRRDVTAGELHHRGTEKVTESNAKGGDGQTGYILVGPQGHGQETIQQPHQQGAEERTDQRDQHSQKRIKLRYMLLIQKRTNHAADTAHIHNTGNTQVQVAGFLRQDLAGGAEQNRHALHHGTLEQRDPSR